MADQLVRCARLDKQLRELSASCTIFHPDARGLRASLRDECESAILKDLALSKRKGVDRLLWSAVFYKPIEEFRRRLTCGAQDDVTEKVQVAGEAFLDEAYVFYVLLASKIQRVYGSVGLVQSLGPEDEALVELAGAPRGEHSASPHADVEAAVCHCHVAMGDLLRYKSTMRTAGEVDWEAIERAYQTAASIHAASGAPFNQLAVLATCRPAPRDPLGAMYNYLRAMGATRPFPQSRANLVSLLRQLRRETDLSACPDVVSRAKLRCVLLLGNVWDDAGSTMQSLERDMHATLQDVTCWADQLQHRCRQQARRSLHSAPGVAEGRDAASTTPPPLVQLVVALCHTMHAGQAAGGAGGWLSDLAWPLADALAGRCASLARSCPGSSAGLELVASTWLLLAWLQSAVCRRGGCTVERHPGVGMPGLAGLAGHGLVLRPGPARSLQPVLPLDWVLRECEPLQHAYAPLCLDMAAGVQTEAAALPLYWQRLHDAAAAALGMLTGAD
ncbi:hypothetical protein ACKKBG_A11500 [Auxenochlorella protothecoides x Auxenochlorella symbiontica]